jgi:hypothetical protein
MISYTSPYYLVDMRERTGGSLLLSPTGKINLPMKKSLKKSSMIENRKS